MCGVWRRCWQAAVDAVIQPGAGHSHCVAGTAHDEPKASSRVCEHGMLLHRPGGGRPLPEETGRTALA